MYAWNIARVGMLHFALTLLARGGEKSGRMPHYQEDPTSRVEDIRVAVDYLVSLPYVKENAIGAMDVCAGGGIR